MLSRTAYNDKDVAQNITKKERTCPRRRDYQPLFREMIPRSYPRKRRDSSLQAPMLNVVLLCNSGPRLFWKTHQNL